MSSVAAGRRWDRALDILSLNLQKIASRQRARSRLTVAGLTTPLPIVTARKKSRKDDLGVSPSMAYRFFEEDLLAGAGGD